MAEFLTLRDLAVRHKGSDSGSIINMAAKAMPAFARIPFRPCSDGVNHRTRVLNELPKGQFRSLYSGVQPEKSGHSQVVDTCGILTAISEVEAWVVDNAKTKGQSGREVRLEESKTFVEGMTQTAAHNFWYGNSRIDKEKILGMMPRYSVPSTDRKNIGFNIINGGGGTANAQTSIYIMCWGDNGVFGLYPEGSKAGVQTHDNGRIILNESDGSRRPVYQMDFEWNIGVCLRDWRSCVRIANIDAASLATAGTGSYTGPNITQLILAALGKIPATLKTTALHLGIYMHPDVMTAWDQEINADSRREITYQDVDGEMLRQFRKATVEEDESILLNESVVTGF